MKQLLTALTLAFAVSVVFVSPSRADWTLVSENYSGTFYVDLERIRKHDGYVYWWRLINYFKPNPNGNLSFKIYSEGDCKVFRFKDLSFSAHKEPMGKGASGDPFTPPDSWFYPAPRSPNELSLKAICNHK